jgi:hypothetical protein
VFRAGFTKQLGYADIQDLRDFPDMLRADVSTVFPVFPERYCSLVNTDLGREFPLGHTQPFADLP